MKILLFGKTGQLGWQLQRALAPIGEVYAPGRAESGGDLSQPDALAHALSRHRPDVIVNAAAYTAVDRAESEPKQAHGVNALAPEVMARHAAASGAVLVHFSTDYVFDGSGDAPWREDSPTGPLNVYGRTKLEGEQAIRASGARHLLLRSSWIYGLVGSNFPKTILRLARERELLKVVDDQFGAPTSAELIADVTAHLLRQMFATGRAGGTYHLAAAGETSWHGYAQFVLEQARRLAGDGGLAVRQLLPVSSGEFPAAARRPHNSRLDTSRLRADSGLVLPPWQEGVARMLTELHAAAKDLSPS